MDTISKKKRSYTMRQVKSYGNKSTELKFISILRQNHITGWRRKYPLMGRPDFVFPSIRLAVFIDGCFWHNCRWHCRMPTSNVNYWTSKTAENQSRDRKINRHLRKNGWSVIRLWEHELKTGHLLQRKIAEITKLQSH